MKNAFKITLTISAYIVGIISIISFIFWLYYVYLLMSGSLDLDKLFIPINTLKSADKTYTYFFIFRQYFSAIGGLIGWYALVKLCLIANYSFSEIPKWLLYSLAIGIFAAYLMPIGGLVNSAPPILLVVILIIRSKINVPNKQVKIAR